jgi:gliding motility-associatede transport system auxiliary component
MAAWRQWALLLATTAGLAGSFGMAQVLLSHQNWRVDLTPEKRYTLSRHAEKVLEGLDRDVQVIAFLRTDDARNPEIVDLLTRAHNVTRHLHYSVVDVNRNPAVARQYGVDNYGSLVVESAGRRREFANPREDLLMEAILQVTRPTAKVVYFLTGHSEQNPSDADRQHGYSNIANALRREFYDVRPLSLLSEDGVPPDASALIIAGPRKDLLATELAKLTDYVERGGDLLILLDPQSAPSLGAFLSRYGVQLRDDVVVDPENRLFAGDYLTMTVPGFSDRHPVSAELKSPPLFSQARSVVFAGVPRPGIRGIEFLHSAPTSWRTTDIEVLRTGVATFVGGRDEQGPIAVGVSLLVESTTGLPPPRTARFIIIGDSDFANNFFLEYLGDKDLLLNSVNWLVGDEGLVAERPQQRTPGVNQFFVSARQGRTAFMLGTVVEPALFLAVGMAIFLRRRWGG